MPSLRLLVPWPVVLLAACGANPDASDSEADLGQVTQEEQCGSTWNVQDVAVYDGSFGVTRAYVERHESAVGQHLDTLNIPAPDGLGCSGTLISDDLFLTAGHCPVEVGESVRFNFQKTTTGALEPTQSFAITQIVERKCKSEGFCSASQLTTDLDYTIVRLSGNPGRTFGYARLAARAPRVGERVTIIQHPEGVPKVTHSALTVAKSGLLPTMFAYVVDTRVKSSGSGVLDANGYLVGVHVDGTLGETNCTTSNPNSGMRLSALVAASPTLQALLAAQSGAFGWTFHHDLAPASYTPASPFQFNSTGASNTVTRTSTGVYEVKLTGLVTGDTAGGAGGNVQISAVGNGGYCKVQSWFHSGSDVIARVACFGTSGTAKNHQFLSVFQRTTFEGYGDDLYPILAFANQNGEQGSDAYAWSHALTYPADTAAFAFYSSNDADRAITISQSDTGTYSVLFPGIQELRSSPLVTAYGSGNVRCQTDEGFSGLGVTAVGVRCTTPSGARANSAFTVSLGGESPAGRLPGGDLVGGFAFADQPTAASYTPNLSRQRSTEGGAITITRQGTGRYTVRFPRPGVSPGKNMPMVTAVGNLGNHCVVNLWSSSVTQLDVPVACFNGAGTATDSTFTITDFTSTVHVP